MVYFAAKYLEPLHGAGVHMDALTFLASPQCKDQPMPHTVINEDPKTRSVLALELTRYGASAFLVGESLVASGNPGTNLAQLIKDGSSPA